MQASVVQELHTELDDLVEDMIDDMQAVVAKRRKSLHALISAAYAVSDCDDRSTQTESDDVSEAQESTIEWLAYHYEELSEEDAHLQAEYEKLQLKCTDLEIKIEKLQADKITLKRCISHREQDIKAQDEWIAKLTRFVNNPPEKRRRLRRE